MNHLDEEQLVLHYYGEDADGEGARNRHLAECRECRENYQSLQLVLNTIDAAATPERLPDYEAEVWKRIGPRLKRRLPWWATTPRWWVLIPATALLVTVAFLAGRYSNPPGLSTATAANQIRERVLLVAVGDHLERSQMVLAEISNAPDGKGKVDISGERQLAEDLLDDNRLYRQTAHRTGDTNVANVLDDLERVLMEIAHSPSEVSKDQFERLRHEIEERGLLFKVRVVETGVRQREHAPAKKL